MNSTSFVDTLPFGHPVWEDFHMSEWVYDHPYGVHTWDPTISHRHWKTHPAHHFLQKQQWVPTKDSDPFDAYLINGNTIRIPKYTKTGDRWTVPKTSAFTNEVKDERERLAYRRWRQQDLANQRYTYRNKYPSAEYAASWMH